MSAADDAGVYVTDLDNIANPVSQAGLAESSAFPLPLENFAAMDGGTVRHNAVRQVQAEASTSEVRQPTDFGQLPSQAVSRNVNPELSFSNLDFSSLKKPQLATATTPQTTLSTPAAVDQVQQITQRVETGVAATAPVSIVPSSTFNLVSVPDATETLVEVANTQTVRARRRSPIGFDARVRGYYEGQVYTTLDGGFQTPVRGDLDATFTKFDPSLIGSTEVISGPYGLRYGSAFSFLNVSTIPTPRYENGPESHVRLGSSIRGNGGQTYNTATLLGGNERMGYFANVGFRKGSDYQAGNGLDIPSSYDAFNLFSGIGFDLNDYTKMETKFSFSQQGDTEYAGQFFDVNDLDHFGLNHSFIREADRSGIGFRIDFWASTTNFDGNTDFSAKRRDDFAVLNRVDAALRAVGPAATAASTFDGVVDGKLTTAGFRAGVTRDLGDEDSVGAGADFRFVRQDIRENYDISSFGFGGDDATIQTGLPTAEVFDPGLYVEATTRLTDSWQTAAGARVAFVSTRAAASDLPVNSNFVDINGDLDEDLDVSDILSSFYITNDIDLTGSLRSRIGLGYAERTPNLTDRYSDGLFLAVVQSGFSRVIGNPTLRKERNWQVDFRIDGDYDFVRTKFSAFHSWIVDYVTYEANVISDPSGARLLQTINTDYATLTGFESYIEADLTRGVQAFGSLAYLDGRDREIDTPLSGISPLEGRLGLRFIDIAPENRYGLETGLRIVNDQDRLGTLRPVQGATDLVGLESRTPGFSTAYIRAYARPTDRVSITCGIENLFDKTYHEHLNLRLPAGTTGAESFNETIVFSPGITPYFGVEVEY